MSGSSAPVPSSQTPAPAAAEDLLPLVYHELRRIAAHRLRYESPGQTLQATALVHDAWMRLGAQSRWNGPEHFLCVAAETMRRILIDRARRKHAIRHGGGWARASLSGIADATAGSADDELLAVHEALDRLASVDARKAELVKLRYFVGLSIEEAAATLGISVPTAKRDWAFARAWLFREVQRPAS